MDSNKIFICCAISSIFMLASCESHVGSSGKSTNGLQQYLHSNDKSLKNRDVPAIAMGNSYDSRFNMPKSYSCLSNYYEPDNIEILNPQGSSVISSLKSAEEISNMMNISMSGKGGWGPFSSSPSALYLQNAIDTRQDLHFNYYQTETADIIYKTKGLGNNILSQDAKDILSGGDDNFVAVCGDSFISSADVGATLYLDLVIHFDSQAHKESFEASIKGKKMNIESVAAEFKTAASSYAKNSVFSVTAMQMGGDVKKLANVFNKPDQIYPVVDCKVEELDQCVEVLNRVIEYASKDFAGSISFDKLDNLTIYNYNATKFKDLGVKVSVNDISEDAKKASLSLIDNIKQDKLMLQYLNKYMEQGYLVQLLPMLVVRNIRDNIEQYKSMIREYDNQDIINACFGPDANTLCPAAWNRIDKTIHPRYSKAIDFAGDMSDTIVVESPDSSKYYYALVPMIGSCNPLGECSGVYALYEQRKVALTTVDFIQDICYVDTTANNSYFSGSDDLKKYVGKSVVCNHIKNYNLSPAENSIYVDRVSNNIKLGDLGEYVNGEERKKPDSRIELKYSDRASGAINHLRYNPI